jgi:hypothetical protein
VAAATVISRSGIQRYLHALGPQPLRRASFMLSTDPCFIEKLREVVDLHLRPPDNAIVLCSVLTRRGQCQALQRTAATANGLRLHRRRDSRLQAPLDDEIAPALDALSGGFVERTVSLRFS